MIPFIASPNHSARPTGMAVQAIIMHATAGSFASALAWLTGAASRVSAHYLIAKDGEVVQLVDEARQAWHAGKSSWPGLPQVSGSLNACSIGIELANANDGRDPYPETQLDTAAALARAILGRHRHALMLRHRDVSPGRKTDPAPPAFDWLAFRARISITPVPMRARYTSFVRQAPTPQSAHVGTLARGEVVVVLSTERGERLANALGTSDAWARLATGYVWWPQLEAL